MVTSSLFPLFFIFSKIVIIAVSASVIAGTPSIATPKPKKERSIFADFIIAAQTLLLFNFASIACNKSVEGLSSITTQFSFSRNLLAFSVIITVFPEPRTPVIIKICCLTDSAVNASTISYVCTGRSTGSSGLFPNVSVNGFCIYAPLVLLFFTLVYCPCIVLLFFTVFYCFAIILLFFTVCVKTFYFFYRMQIYTI